MFDSLNSEYKILCDELQQKKEEIKSRREHERNIILDKGNISYSERKNAKIVSKPDGTTQIYSGGIGKADGIGHGHVALDSAGQKTYERKAFEKHGSQNYKNNNGGVTIYDRNKRTNHQVKGISGGVNLHGDDYYKGKKQGVIGHSTLYYDDNYRLSLDTYDGIREENTHWTNQGLPKGHPNSHDEPDDLN